jgi:hypothetical protein
MCTTDFITQLFCRIDDQLMQVANVRKHPQASLYPSEVVTLALLFCLKGVGNRAFYRWAHANLLPFFPKLPERTRLFRLFAAHKDWANHFLAEPTVLGLADTYGIALIHPKRARRSPKQIGKFGISNDVWVYGGKLCLVLNKWGLVCGWDCATANVHDTTFHPLIRQFEDQMVVIADHGFYSAKGTERYGKRRRKVWAEPNEANPRNLKICKTKAWNSRMIVETVLSMLTVVCRFKKLSHRVWIYFQARLAYTMALFNVLAQWHGLLPDAAGRVHLSIAHFTL